MQGWTEYSLIYFSYLSGWSEFFGNGADLESFTLLLVITISYVSAWTSLKLLLESLVDAILEKNRKLYAFTQDKLTPQNVTIYSCFSQRLLPFSVAHSTIQHFRKNPGINMKHFATYLFSLNIHNLV